MAKMRLIQTSSSKILRLRRSSLSTPLPTTTPSHLVCQVSVMASRSHKMPRIMMPGTLSSISMISLFWVALQALASQPRRFQPTIHCRRLLTSVTTSRICAGGTRHSITQQLISFSNQRQATIMRVYRFCPSRCQLRRMFLTRSSKCGPKFSPS